MVIGFAFDASGRCWVCDAGDGRVVVLRPDRSVEAVITAVEGVRLRTPNFPAVARDGSVWLTDSGSAWGADDGFLARLADGSGRIVDRACCRFPNGLALDADQTRLLLVESRLPGIVEYDLRGGPRLARREVLVMPRTVPDGLAFDTGGNLYIGCWRPDRVYRLSPAGALDVYLDDFTAEYLISPTNLCFGGSDGRRMYLAGFCGTAIRELDVDPPGILLPSSR